MNFRMDAESTTVHHPSEVAESKAGVHAECGGIRRGLELQEQTQRSKQSGHESPT